MIKMGKAGYKAMGPGQIAPDTALQPANPAEHAPGRRMEAGAEGVLRGAGLPGGCFRAGGAFPEAGGAQPRGLGGAALGRPAGAVVNFLFLQYVAHFLQFVFQNCDFFSQASSAWTLKPAVV